MTAPAGGSANDATVVTGPPESLPDAIEPGAVGTDTDAVSSPASDALSGPDDAVPPDREVGHGVG